MSSVVLLVLLKLVLLKQCMRWQTCLSFLIEKWQGYNMPVVT